MLTQQEDAAVLGAAGFTDVQMFYIGLRSEGAYVVVGAYAGGKCGEFGYAVLNPTLCSLLMPCSSSFSHSRKSS